MNLPEINYVSSQKYDLHENKQFTSWFARLILKDVDTAKAVKKNNIKTLKEKLGKPDFTETFESKRTYYWEYNLKDLTYYIAADRDKTSYEAVYYGDIQDYRHCPLVGKTSIKFMGTLIKEVHDE